MQVRHPHLWPDSKVEADRLQEEAAARVRLLPLPDEPETITAVEAVHGSDGDMLYACATTMSFPELEEIDYSYAQQAPGFPYVPGLLYFREGPVIHRLLSELTTSPQLLIVHGHGTAHPLSCGLASHLGVVFDIPTIGCCRRLLVGHHRELAPNKGAVQPITLGPREVGLAYRSRDKVKPIFISPGHLCDRSDAVDIVRRCLRGFRQPEPLRLAHLMANKYKRSSEKKLRTKPGLVGETV